METPEDVVTNLHNSDLRRREEEKSISPKKMFNDVFAFKVRRLFIDNLSKETHVSGKQSDDNRKSVEA